MDLLELVGPALAHALRAAGGEADLPPGLDPAVPQPERFPELAFQLRSRFPGAPESLEAYRRSVLSRSVSLTLLAGSASRWRRSLDEARVRGELRGEAAAFDPERPRGLFPVRNILGRGGSSLPIASYALHAARELGFRHIVVRGWEAEIEAEILRPLGIQAYAFHTQAAPYGKPLGHGDAAWQCREAWRGAEYLLANFGGDAASPLTVEAGLLALDALISAGLELDFLLPAALLAKPAYPINLDGAGLPLSFGHAKLSGTAGPSASRVDGIAFSNVGVRVYRAPALAAVLEELHERYWVEGSGYAIPGNDPEGAEMALDNADFLLAERGRARILPVARPEELRPVKTLADIPAFEAAIARILPG